MISNTSASYKGAHRGKLGSYIRFWPGAPGSGRKNLYGVLLDSETNKDSSHGVFWFYEEELEPIDMEAVWPFVCAEERMFSVNKIDIKNVIFNNPATIVFWTDGTKTVVKCGELDDYDPEKGLAMAIAKKALGNKGNYCNVFKKWLPKEDNACKNTECLIDTFIRKINDTFGDLSMKEEPERDCGTCKYETERAYSTPCIICYKASNWEPKEEKNSYDPVQRAYDILVSHRDKDDVCDLDEVIGYLGEALDE